MKVYLWATHTAEFMSTLRLQLEEAGIEYEIPEGATWGKTNNGWADRMIDYHKFACRERGTLLFIDPWDNLFFGTKGELLEKYLSFDSPLVWAAEKICWPPMLGTNDWEDPINALSFPDVPSPYRFPNGGGIIGEAEVFREIFDPAMIPNFGQNNYNTSYCKHPRGNQIWMDQAYFQELYKRGLGKLDHQCRIFQTIVKRKPGDFERIGNRVKNTITGEFPMFIHANGKVNYPKEFMEALLG